MDGSSPNGSVMEDEEGVDKALESLVETAAEGYFRYKFGVGLQTYGVPVIVTVGVVGNLLSFLVMVLPRNRRLPCCAYLAMLAISDTVMLYVGTHIWAYQTFYYEHVMPHWLCVHIVLVFQIAQQNGIFLIVAMTVDRFIAVRHPLKYSSICTVSRARVTTACVLCLVCAINVPYAYYVKVNGRNTCASLAVKSRNSTIFAYCGLALNCVVPFTVLIVLNSMIIHRIRSRRKVFTPHTYNNNNNSSSRRRNSIRTRTLKGSPSATGSIRSSRSRDERQMTAMLVLVTFALLVLTTPQYTRYLVFSIVEFRSDPGRYATYILVYHVSQKLAYVNHAVNFFLYCISGARFRRDALRLITCARFRQGASDSATLTSNSKHASNASLASLPV